MSNERKFVAHPGHLVGPGSANKLPGTILNPTAVQKLRQKVVDRERLTEEEILSLISSHEHLRAHALASRNKMTLVARENVDLREFIAKRS